MLAARQLTISFPRPTILDAGGRVPVAKTTRECEWSGLVSSGELQRRFDALMALQQMPLEAKIEMASTRISEWYEAFGGKVAVSYSGGKDSSVLLWLVRRLYPDVPAVFANTGLEYPEIVRMVKNTPGTVIVRPKMPFHRVISTYGWPLISKKVARGIAVLRNKTDGNQNITRLYESGVNRFGERVNGFKVPARWRFLVNAPFSTSDRCCGVMKKEPMHRYCRESGRVMFIGTLAADSKLRQKTYLVNGGCNVFDAKEPKSTPLGPWTEQDVLRCIQLHNIPVAEVYGQLLEQQDGTLRFSGTQRTGCVFCGFGLHMDGESNRFLLLKASHPKLYAYCMDKLGLGDVLAYLHTHCPDRKQARCFDANGPDSKQLNLWRTDMPKHKTTPSSLTCPGCNLPFEPDQVVSFDGSLCAVCEEKLAAPETSWQPKQQSNNITRRISA